MSPLEIFNKLYKSYIKNQFYDETLYYRLLSIAHYYSTDQMKADFKAIRVTLREQTLETLEARFRDSYPSSTYSETMFYLRSCYCSEYVKCKRLYNRWKKEHEQCS